VEKVQIKMEETGTAW